MGSEAVGGHTPRPGEFDWDPNADTASLGALERAFKGALEKPRYFRNMVQWSAVWHRYATAAVATGQMTWPMVLSHANQMKKLAEEERNSGTGPALVFVHDELLRKSIATWAEWGDPSLDLMTAFGEVEKQVLEAARTRVLQTGFSRQKNQRNQNGQDANSRVKDGAEAQTLALKASQAAKELAKQQTRLETSNKDKGGGKDSGKKRTNKQKKAEQFFDKRTQSIEKKRWETSHRSEW